MSNNNFFQISDENELIIVYPDGAVDRTGIFANTNDRLIVEQFGASSVGMTLLSRLRTREIHDVALTGLLLRNPGLQMISRRLEDFASYPSSGSISVLVIDLDFFKQVNDTHGHTVGDRVLSWFADIVHKRVRVSDVSIRWGGDEFVIFSSMFQKAPDRSGFRDRDAMTPEFHRTGTTDQNLNAIINNGECVAKRILDSMKAGPCMVGGIRIAQTATIGVATQLVIPGMDLEGAFDRLYQAADQALVAGKERNERNEIHSAQLLNDPQKE